MEWQEIEGFPGYSVSNFGRVRRDETGRIMTLTRNQHGIVQVGLMKDGHQFKRSVALLVARAFLEPPHPDTFDTPIHLDGDTTNNRVDNLMWRPRWFAVKYQRQFNEHEAGWRGFRDPIVDINTGVHYKDSRDAATKCGLLEKDIFQAILHRTYVWPTYQRFRATGK